VRSGTFARRCLLGVALCVALGALAALSACSGAGAGTADDEFRIGLLAPLSGPPPIAAARDAAEALVERVNAEGGLSLGGRRLKVRLLVEDTGGQVERAMAATVRLISQARVSALVGPFFSRDALPAARLAEQSHVPMVSPSASNPQLTKDRRFIFRVCMVDTVQGRVMARYAFEDLGLRRAAVLYDEADAYPRGLAGLFCESFARLGGRIVARETYATGATDFAAQLARLRAAGAQALFLPNYAQDVVLQMAQARAAGFTGVFLGGDSWDADKSVNTLPQAEGAFFATDYAGQARHEAGRNAKEIAVAQGKAAALTLDALGVVLAGAEAAGGTDPVTLREGIAALRGYKGQTGSLSFERGGDAVRSAHIMVIEGGQARSRKVLEPAS